MDLFAAQAPPQTWRLTVPELGFCCDRLGLARALSPLVTRSGPPTAEVLASLRGRGLAGGDGTVDPQLATALAVLARPQSGVAAFGWYGDRPETLVRVRAARTGSGGVLALQLPGADERTGGDVLLREVPGARIAHEAVAALPALRPGRRDALTATAAAPDEGAVRRAAADDRSAVELRELLGGPATGGGQLATWTASAEGEARETTLRWWDAAADGRYLLDSSDPGTLRAVPVDCARLGDAVDAALARLVDRVSDRATATPLQR